MKSTLSIALGLSTLVACSNILANEPCAMDVGGFGHDYVCVTTLAGPTWCNVSADGCHQKLDFKEYHYAAAYKNTQCTKDGSPVTEDNKTIDGKVITGPVAKHSTLTGPQLFSPIDGWHNCFFAITETSGWNANRW